MESTMVWWGKSAMQTCRIEEMTWVEIKEAIAHGYDRVIVALGSIEQHGPHLPLVMDTLLGDALADRIAANLGRTLVAPTIRPGCSEHHLSFSGSLSISGDLLAALTRAYCHSFARHGFRTIFLLPSHGGNFPTVARVAPELTRELSIPVVGYTDLVEFTQMFDTVAARFGITPAESGVHAGCSETAIMLALRPDLVRQAKAQPGFMGDFAEEMRKLKPSSSGYTIRLEDYSPIGVLGDPRRASAELGNALLDGLAERLAAYYRATLA